MFIVFFTSILTSSTTKKVWTYPFSTDCYIIDFQQKPIGTFQKSKDIAPLRPVRLLTSVFSVYFCDVFWTPDTRQRDTGLAQWSRVPRPEVPRPEVPRQKENL